MFLGSCNGHVEQPALLLQSADAFATHGRREYVFLKTNDEDCPELQSLGCMDSHQHHLRFVLLTLRVKVGHQRHILQKIA